MLTAARLEAEQKRRVVGGVDYVAFCLRCQWSATYHRQGTWTRRVGGGFGVGV